MVISRRFCGPPDVANGGYACGRLARSLGLTAATVALRRPVPIDQELEVRRTPVGGGLWRGAQLLAQCEPATVDIGLRVAVNAEEAAASTLTRTEVERQGLGGLACFVCGADREDGLRLLPGPLPRLTAVAAAWTPRDRTLSDDGSTVCTEVVWAALDCPGAWIDPARGTGAVLARFAVKQLVPVRLDQQYAVAAELTGASSRGFQATSAVLDGHGSAAAVAWAQWIYPRAAPAPRSGPGRNV